MTDHSFIAVGADAAGSCEPPWDPVIFRAGEIAAEVERLAAVDPSSGVRRASLFVHHRAPAGQPSLAPGIRVALEVLLPGERTPPTRHNSTMVGFCIGGRGDVRIGRRRHVVGRYDVWTYPSWQRYEAHNGGDEPFVWVAYSNAPLLERLGVHVTESASSPERPTAEATEATAVDGRRTNGDVHGPDEVDERHASPYGTFELGDGALLMPYETLINPPASISASLLWRWEEVMSHIDRLEDLGERYLGRRLYLLYNPSTGRTNGTSPSFFATMTMRPAGIVDRPHRHVSAAINYFFHGSGWSRVGGRRYRWSAGDLMLTAPGWVVHNHASDAGDRVYELTIQDQPFHIGMESLLWQEDLKHPARVLGAEAGFVTNRADGGSS